VNISPTSKELIWGITEASDLTHYSISQLMAVSECTVAAWAIGVHTCNKVSKQFLTFLRDACQRGGKDFSHKLANEHHIPSAWFMVLRELEVNNAE
jgi:hypothetical protein